MLGCHEYSRVKQIQFLQQNEHVISSNDHPAGLTAVNLHRCSALVVSVYSAVTAHCLHAVAQTSMFNLYITCKCTPSTEPQSLHLLQCFIENKSIPIKPLQCPDSVLQKHKVVYFITRLCICLCDAFWCLCTNELSVKAAVTVGTKRCYSSVQGFNQEIN